MNQDTIPNDAYDYIAHDGQLYRFYPLIVIGGGPHSLSFVARLLCEDQADTDGCSDSEKRIASIWRKKTGTAKKPDALLRKQILQKCIRVFDDSGTWLSAWSSLFSTMELKYLRSPSFLHPDPYETNALRELLLHHSVRTGESFGKISKLHLLPADIERFGAHSASRMAKHLTTEWKSTIPSAENPLPIDTPWNVSYSPLDVSPDICYPRLPTNETRSCSSTDGLCPCPRSHTREIGFTMHDKDRFSLPSNVLFLSCCKYLLEQRNGILDNLIEKGKVTRIIPMDTLPNKGTGTHGTYPGPWYQIQVESSETKTKEFIFTNYVVVATGAQNLPIIPEWIKDTLNSVVESETGSRMKNEKDTTPSSSVHTVNTVITDDPHDVSVQGSIERDEKDNRFGSTFLPMGGDPVNTHVTRVKNPVSRFDPISYRHLLHTADIPSLFPVTWKDKLNFSYNYLVDNDGKHHPSALRALFRNRRIVIIGGGQSACNLLQVASVSACVSVTMVSRKTITVRNYDIGSIWMSRMRPLLRKKFYSLSADERVLYIKKCRNGGTVQPEVFSSIRPFLKQRTTSTAKNGTSNEPPYDQNIRSPPIREQSPVESTSAVVNIIEEDEIIRAKFDNVPNKDENASSLNFSGSVSSTAPWLLTTRKGVELRADIVILATGTEINVYKESLFKDLLIDNPRYKPQKKNNGLVSHGFPIPDEELRWPPASPVDPVIPDGTEKQTINTSRINDPPSVSNIFLLGAWASLQLGPDALNMAGAMTGSKILWPILRPVLDYYIHHGETSVASSSCRDHPETKIASSDDDNRKEDSNPTLTRSKHTTNYSSKAQESLNRKFGGDGNLFAVLDPDD